MGRDSAADIDMFIERARDRFVLGDVDPVLPCDFLDALRSSPGAFRDDERCRHVRGIAERDGQVGRVGDHHGGLGDILDPAFLTGFALQSALTAADLGVALFFAGFLLQLS